MAMSTPGSMIASGERTGGIMATGPLGLTSTETMVISGILVDSLWMAPSLRQAALSTRVPLLSLNLRPKPSATSRWLIRQSFHLLPYSGRVDSISLVIHPWVDQRRWHLQGLRSRDGLYQRLQNPSGRA